MGSNRGDPRPDSEQKSGDDDRWSIRVELLSPTHVRTKFTCGHDSLDRFVREFAAQNARNGVSQTFVAVERGADRVLGYYSLAAGKVEATAIPERLRKRLPRYPIPVVLLGRLAVDSTRRGMGLGEYLLLDAMARSVRVANSIGVHALEVVAIDAAAAAFYRKYGFVDLTDAPEGRHLFLPIETIAKLKLPVP